MSCDRGGMTSYLSCDKGGVTCLSHDRGNPITVEPPIKDTLKEDEPLNKISLQKEDNLSTKDKKAWSQVCPYLEVPFHVL